MGPAGVFRGLANKIRNNVTGAQSILLTRGFSLLAASTDQRRKEQEGGRGGKRNIENSRKRCGKRK